jgi:hypothetical protein
MSAADRRVIHLALADVPGLSTRSEGEGAARRLLIIPDPNYDFASSEKGHEGAAGAAPSTEKT